LTAAQANESARPPARAAVPAGRGRCGRLLSFLGMLTLCVSFFLPHVHGCDAPVVPSEEAADDPTFMLGLGLPFTFAAVMALVYVLRWLAGLLRRLRGREGPSAGWNVAVCALSIIVLLHALIPLGIVTWQTFPFTAAPSWEEMMWPGLGGLVAVLAFLSVAAAVGCPGRIKPPIGVIACGLSSLAYFSVWVMGGPDNVYYGLWVSLAGSAAIAAGAGWETLRLLVRPRPRLKT